jgi:hypothetical protein
MPAAVAIQAPAYKQKTANTTTGKALLEAADIASSGYLEDDGAQESTIYRVWIRAQSSTLYLGGSGHGSSASNDYTKLIQIPSSAGDVEIGYFRRSDLDGIFVYGSVNVHIQAAKVVASV